MATVVRLQRAHCGSHYRKRGLCGCDTAMLINPFLAVDHVRIGAPACPPRAHAGYSVANYVFLDSETGIRQRDALGAEHLIQPGGLRWTAAGSGVVLDDLPAESGRVAHMLRILVNLPQGQQGADPFSLNLAPQDVPVLRLPGVKVRVPLGEYAGAHSPLAPPTQVGLIDVLLEEGASLTLPVAADHTAFVMAIHGTTVIDGEAFDGNELRLPVFPAEQAGRDITLTARHGRARAAVFSGLPLHQPVLWHDSIAATPEARANPRAIPEHRPFGELSTHLD